MAKRSNQPLHKHTLNLYDGDFQRLGDLYPAVGAAIIIREIVHTFLNKVENGADKNALPVKIDPALLENLINE